MARAQYASLKTEYQVSETSTAAKKEVASILSQFGQFSTYEQKLGAVWNHIRHNQKQISEFKEVCDKLLRHNRYIATHQKARNTVEKYLGLASSKLHEYSVLEQTQQYDIYSTRSQDQSSLETAVASDLFETPPARGTYEPIPEEKIVINTRVPESVHALAVAIMQTVPRPEQIKRKPRYNFGLAARIVGYAAKAAAIALAGITSLSSMAPVKETKAYDVVPTHKIATPITAIVETQIPDLHLIEKDNNAGSNIPKNTETTKPAYTEIVKAEVKEPITVPMTTTLENKLRIQNFLNRIPKQTKRSLGYIETLTPLRDISSVNPVNSISAENAYMSVSSIHQATSLLENRTVKIKPFAAEPLHPSIGSSNSEEYNSWLKQAIARGVTIYGENSGTNGQVTKNAAKKDPNFIDEEWFARAQVKAERRRLEALNHSKIRASLALDQN